MASLRRSKTMPADGQTAKFLYTIIKQLDLKSIDWALVASQLEITNGHAARMRFSRFKQHMEGTPTIPRTPRPKKPKQEKGDKAELKKRNLGEMTSGQDDADLEFGPKVKREMAVRNPFSGGRAGPGGIGNSIGSDDGFTSQSPIPAIPSTMSESGDALDPFTIHPSVEAKAPTIKLEPEETVKVEVKVEPKNE